jgi:hypothetical protein
MRKALQREEDRVIKRGMGRGTEKTQIEQREEFQMRPVRLLILHVAVELQQIEEVLLQLSFFPLGFLELPQLHQIHFLDGRELLELVD